MSIHWQNVGKGVEKLLTRGSHFNIDKFIQLAEQIHRKKKKVEEKCTNVKNRNRQLMRINKT
jgi:hypothetical protein